MYITKIKIGTFSGNTGNSFPKLVITFWSTKYQVCSYKIAYVSQKFCNSWNIDMYIVPFHSIVFLVSAMDLANTATIASLNILILRSSKEFQWNSWKFVTYCGRDISSVENLTINFPTEKLKFAVVITRGQ